MKMNKFAMGALALVGFGLIGFLAVENWPLPAPLPTVEMAGDAKRGAYLARLSGCVTCHTVPGQAPLSGGAPLASRFGSFYPPNITSDENAGIGRWTLAQFDRAVRQGISPNGDPYYPAFPYEFYASLTNRAIIAARSPTA